MVKAVCIILASILVQVVSAQAAELTVKSLDTKQPIGAYTPAQWSVDLGRSYADPFDPNEISVDATFTDDQGKTWVMPAFWFEPPTEPSLVREDAGTVAQWRIRFAPTHAGQWVLVVHARDKDGTRSSEAVRFDVAPSDNPGMVRRAADHPRYLAFDSGALFFTVGLNLAWVPKYTIEGYQDWFEKLSKAGGNFARVWITQGRVLETKQSGLGRYDANMAAYFERVLELAQADGIRVMLTLNAPGMFGGSWWKDNPYNAANGGPVQQKLDYVKNPVAIQYHERRLRYMVARYSAFTSLAFWELWNEQEHVGGVPDQWNKRESEYLKKVDPYQHLVTTSSGEDCAGVWPMPSIDLSQVHLYGAGSWAHFDEAVAMIASSYSAYGKPFMVGEFGVTWDWNNNGESGVDKAAKGTELHNAMWTSAMTGCAGTAMTWWWIDYIDPHNLWHLFTGISRFSETIPWVSRDFQPLRVDSPMKPSSAGGAGDAKQTWQDMQVPLTPAWALAPDVPIKINANGSAYPAVPAMMFSPYKRSLYRPTVLKVNLPRPSTMVLNIKKVSVSTDLKISVDGKLAREYKFVAAPGAADAESITLNKKYSIYQAVLNKDIKVDLSAGEHTIRIENMTGDWVDIGSLTFIGARSSRYSDLRTYAMQDETTGDTIAWMLDPDSNWKNDNHIDGLTGALRTWQGAVLSIPMPKSAVGSYNVQWWDMRSGEVIAQETGDVQQGVLKLHAPTFERDVAVHVYRAGEGAKAK